MYYSRLSFFDTFKACFFITMVVSLVLAPKLMKRYNEYEKSQAQQIQTEAQQALVQQNASLDVASASLSSNQTNF